MTDVTTGSPDPDESEKQLAQLPPPPDLPPPSAGNRAGTEGLGPGGVASEPAESDDPEGSAGSSGSPGSPGSPDTSASARVAKSQHAKTRRRRSVSTPALYSLLLVIGLIGGLGVGYAVQSQRSPTPLPPLAAAQPTYPPTPLFTGQQPSPLPSGDDDATIVSGDLPQVLLPTPVGATATPGLDHIWLTLADGAANCTNQAACFSSELSEGVSRIAQTGWATTDGVTVQITITQYSPGFSAKADDDYTDYQQGGTDTTALPSPPGTDAAGYSYADTDDPGSTDFMVALHGNLMIEFLVSTAGFPAPDSSYIDGLVTQQLARL